MVVLAEGRKWEKDGIYRALVVMAVMVMMLVEVVKEEKWLGNRKADTSSLSPRPWQLVVLAERRLWL